MFYQLSIRKGKDSDVHLAKFKRVNLNNEKIYPWFNKGYNSYRPDPLIIDSLMKIKQQIRIIVFGGSWCSDTKDLLPAFYKTAEGAGISAKSIRLIGVDRQKDSHDAKSKRYHITNVPTFVFFYKGKEIGRIVESVNQSIEKDMMAIYRHQYIINKKP